MSVRLLLVLMVFLLDLWALVQVTALPQRRRRLRWIALIVGVPVVGVLLWIRRGALRA